MRRLAIGDIQGGCRLLVQVLERAGFDDNEDLLIILGDVCDGWAETRECVDRLLQIKHKVFVRGNHDQWLIEHINTGWAGSIWTSQGGAATLKSYSGGIPHSHRDFFLNSIPYHELATVDGDALMLFIHGGLTSRHTPPFALPTEVLMWDRAMVFSLAVDSAHVLGYRHVYVGHTTTQAKEFGGDTLPVTIANVTLLDTGGGWDGKLTIMDVDTHEYWQSDDAPTLYPEEKGRMGVLL